MVEATSTQRNCHDCRSPLGSRRERRRGHSARLIVVPVGVAILVLLWSAGFVAAIVGFVVAFGATFLYRRGSGGIISRVGAWILVAIVLGTLVLGLWLSLVVDYAGGLGHLDNLSIPQFWTDFARDFPTLLAQNPLSEILVIVFGALGSFRVLGRAFATARITSSSQATSATSNTIYPQANTTCRNDIDGAPTGSADDKTAPPASGL